jgi:hypothetical protein
MRLVSRRTEALRLLVTYLKLALKDRALTTPQLRDTVVTHVHDLVALAITGSTALGESRMSAVVAARLSAALEYIAGHFEDPGLSVEAAARGRGISPRYLQRLAGR